MRTKLVKIVVILLLSGLGDSRPQKTESLQPQATKVNAEERKSAQFSSTPKNIREDSRYTWNSGNCRIPYINQYHDNSNPFIKAEVSVEKFRNLRTFSDDRDSSDNSNISEISANKYVANKLEESVRDGGHRISKIFNEGTITNENLTKSRNLFRRQSKVLVSRVNSGSSSNSFTTPSRNLRQRFNSVYSNLRSPHLKNRKTAGSLRDSSNVHVKASNRRTEIELNNSRSELALGYNPKVDFVDPRVEFSTEFDHVAAIKKITDALTNENVAKLPSESNHDFRDHVQSIVSFPHGSSFTNRHWNLKHSNRTKFRQPPGGQNKNNRNKIVSNKILVSKVNASAENLHLKNWPNGAIQNVDDYQNYEKYTSLNDNTNLDKPVSSENTNVNHLVPIMSPNLQEIVHWLKIPAFMTNGSHVVESGQVNDPISVVFDPVYQNLEPNKPARPSTLQTFKPAFLYPFNSQTPTYTTEKMSSWLGNIALKNRTAYNPQTQVSQNTVVHLINTDPRKPNKTMIATKVPEDSGKPVFSPPLFLSQLSPFTTTSKPGPNVHIGFTSYANNTPDHQEPQAPLVTYDQKCPTILINSYTRINNTIQSKEGCNDLNIIINSHVFNTNTVKSTPSPEVYQTYGEANPGPSHHQSDPIHQSSSSGTSQWPQNGYYSPQKDPQTSVPQENGVHSVQVFQGAQISISNTQEDDVSLFDEAPVEDLDETVLPDESLNSVAFENSPVTESETNQANDVLGLNSAVESVDAASVSDPSSSSDSPSTGLTEDSSSTVSSSNEDDDDDFDLSPTGIMESIASVFTYFTFVNPLHYGFFSLAAAPFTALAAGILGIFSFVFPWAFPSSLNFKRANGNDAVGFWPSIEELVWQSIDKYGRLNEWKSRKKKRKRRRFFSRK